MLETNKTAVLVVMVVMVTLYSDRFGYRCEDDVKQECIHTDLINAN